MFDINKKEVCLYFVNELMSPPRIHVSIEEGEKIRTHAFSTLKENFGDEFVSWFKQNVSPLLSDFNFVFNGEGDEFFALYKVLYSKGAMVSIIA